MLSFSAIVLLIIGIWYANFASLTSNNDKRKHTELELEKQNLYSLGQELNMELIYRERTFLLSLELIV